MPNEDLYTASVYGHATTITYNGSAGKIRKVTFRLPAGVDKVLMQCYSPTAIRIRTLAKDSSVAVANSMGIMPARTLFPLVVERGRECLYVRGDTADGGSLEIQCVSDAGSIWYKDEVDVD